MLTHAIRVERGSRGEDRAAVVHVPAGLVVVVADGAGGTGSGAAAADALCARVVAAAQSGARGADAWAACLREADRQARTSGVLGDTTAVVLEVTESGVCGASVGDSEAWIVHSAEVVELTAGQRRKPLIGSGQASPVSFGPTAWSGRLLVATDGLIKYASARHLAAAASLDGLEDAARALVERVRLPSGALPDDVALVLIESERTGASGVRTHGA
jgi:serine/threonine protein phosphatase PrpC